MTGDSKDNAELVGVEALKRDLAHAPGSPGVYRMLGSADEILYIGKARQLKNRIGQYAQLGNLSNMKLRMVQQIAKVEWTTTRNEGEALLMEAAMVKKHQPRYNVLLKDDKSFPYIAIDKTHPFPAARKYRGKQKPKTDYFGPFPSAGLVDATLTILQKAFLLRNCTDHDFATRQRPCLQYQIKRCSAPCVGKLDEKEYGELIRQTREFLHGKNQALQDELRTQMMAASEAEEFEKAASLRDRMVALTRVAQTGKSHAAAVGEADVLALAREGGMASVQVMFYRGGQYLGGRAYFPKQSADASDAEIMEAFLGQFYATREAPRNLLLNVELEETAWLEEGLSREGAARVQIHTPQRGDKRQAVEEALSNAQSSLKRKAAEDMAQARWLSMLAERLELSRIPARIEVYDNSHISGTHAVGGMVVFGEEGWMKKHYRTFNFDKEKLEGGDDYAMLRAVLTRRLTRLKEQPYQPGDGMWPDMLLIDGGLGQLSVAQEVLSASGLENIQLLAIAKGPDRNAGREQFFMPSKPVFQWPVDDELLHFMQRLRDEAHRFAIGTHRNKRSRAITKNPLDEIEGIGPTRKKALLTHFGSARAVSNASVEEIAAVKGISEEMAGVIFAYFHG